MISALWFITLRQWRTHRLRLVLTTLGIALGVGVFFAVRTTNITLAHSLQITVERLAGKATLEITAGESGFSEDVLQTVRSTPGVKAAEPIIEVVAHTPLEAEGNLLVLGIDTTSDQQMREYEFDKSQTQVADPLIFIAQPFSILLSRKFADEHGLKTGDKLPLYTSQGRKDFTVEGTFAPAGIGEVFGGNVAVIDVYAAQFVFDRGKKFDRIDVMNSPGVLVDTLQQKLQAELPAGLDVVRPEVRGAALQNNVDALQEGMVITSFIALLVGVYIIFNSFTINVNQRWKEIGILRAVGVERRNVTVMFLSEALLIGAVGSVLGIFAGYYMASASARLMGSAVASVYGLVSSPGTTVFRWDIALTSFLMGLVCSLVGACFPVRRAARLEPTLALHNIEACGLESVLGWGRAATGATLLLASVLLIHWSPQKAGVTAQYIYAGVMLVGLVALLPKIVLWSAQALRPVMDWAGGSEGALAMDAMIEAPRRSSATVGALMIGLMFVFSTGAFIQSYRNVMDRWMKRLLNSDLFVASSQLLRSPTYHFNEDLARQIAQIPGVKRAENVRFASVEYDNQEVALMAYQMSDFMSRAGYAVDEGNERVARQEMPQGKGALISRNFSTRFGVTLGDHLHLKSPTGLLDLPVLGIMDDYRWEKGTIFIDRSLYKERWKDDGVDFVDIQLNPGVNAAVVKREIERLTANTAHAFVYTNAEFRGWVFGLVNQFFMLNYIQLVIAILVAMLGIVNTLVISVAERRREIGIIRAIGGCGSQVRKMVLLEAAAISMVGLVAGALAALFCIYFMVHTVAMVLAGYTVPFDYPWAMILLTLPILVAIALAAGWFPARRAVRVAVVEAIGYE
jgi:putative ABC transport system permease protein